MDKNTTRIKLNENDRKTLLNNSNICTDSHGEGCGAMNSNERDESLNYRIYPVTSVSYL